ncbi:hypothetical protein DXG01_001033 [Tephrocybe rancida]|nr:hypothetical protein DXG01_001033 [Tephrocybe rancida]
MSFSNAKNVEINGGILTNIAGDNYNTRQLTQYKETTPDGVYFMPAAASVENNTHNIHLNKSEDVHFHGATQVTNVTGDNYNVKNLSLSYADGTSSEWPVQHIDILILNALEGLNALLSATSPSAAFNSRDRYPPPKCHPGTRQAILDEIAAWVDKGPGVGETERVLWVHGPAGAGKSAVAQTIAENCDHQKLLAASFFFSRAHAARNSIDKLFITIAYQLAVSIPPLRPAILSSFSNDPSIVNQIIPTQVDKLIIAPLRTIILESHSAPSAQAVPFVVIIDGLDECAGKSNHYEVLDQIHKLVKTPGVSLRFIVVSRPEYIIKDTFQRPEFSAVCSTPVDLYGDLRAHEDVRSFLDHEFARIRNSPEHRPWMSHLPSLWPTKSEVDCLVEKSGGYFIYAVTLVKFVDQEDTSPIRHLDLILSSQSSRDRPFEELDKLYRHILSEIIELPVRPVQVTEVHQRKWYHFLYPALHQQRSTVLKEVLRAIAGEVPDISIPEIYGLEFGQVSLTLRGLQSIMLVHDTGKYESFHRPAHATVYDFLFDPARAGQFHISPVNENFWADQFCLMLDYLHRYNLGTQTMDWSQPPPEPSLRTVTYIYDHDGLLSVWRKAGSSNQSVLLKAIQTKSHNFWFPLPPSAPVLPWGDVKFESLAYACYRSMHMLAAGRGAEDAPLALYFSQVCDTVLKPIFSPPGHLLESSRIISVYISSIFRVMHMTRLLGLQHPLHPPILKLLSILSNGTSTPVLRYMENIIPEATANACTAALCLELIATSDMDETLADLKGGATTEQKQHTGILKKLKRHVPMYIKPSLTKKCNARAIFLQKDTANALCIINWLKKHSPQPHNLLANWETYHAELYAAQKNVTEAVLVTIEVAEDGTETEEHWFNPVGGPFAPFETEKEWLANEGTQASGLDAMST